MKTIIRRNPMPIFFDEFIDGKIMGNRFLNQSAPQTFHYPAINIRETEKEFLIEIAAPGMEKEDFKITVEKNLLTVSTERKEETAQVTEGYARKEFGYIAFKRSFTLPEGKIDPDRIEAKYDAGVLKLHVPKKSQEELKSIKTVVIE